MTANVTQITGAVQADIYLGNYTYSDILANMELLRFKLDTAGTDRIFYKNAAGDLFKIMTDSSDGSNHPEGRLMFTDPDGAVETTSSLAWDGTKLTLTPVTYFGNYLELTEIVAPATPAAGNSRLYEKTDKLLYFKNADGTEFDLTCSGTITGTLTTNYLPVATGANTLGDSPLYASSVTASVGGMHSGAPESGYNPSYSAIGAGNGGITSEQYSTSASIGAKIWFMKSNTATINNITLLDDGDAVGELAWVGADGAKYVKGAKILAAVDGAAAVDDMPMELQFWVNSGTTDVDNQALTIDSLGHVGIGETTPDSDAILHCKGDSVKLLLEDLSTGVKAGFRLDNSIASFGSFTNHGIRFLANDTAMMQMGATGDLAIGENFATADSKLHIWEATAGVVTAATNTILTLESDDDEWLSFLTPDAKTCGFLFGRATDNDVTKFYCNHDFAGSGIHFSNSLIADCLALYVENSNGYPAQINLNAELTANGSSIGNLIFSAQDIGGNPTNYSHIGSSIISSAVGHEYGDLGIYTMEDSVETEIMNFTKSATTLATDLLTVGDSLTYTNSTNTLSINPSGFGAYSTLDNGGLHCMVSAPHPNLGYAEYDSGGVTVGRHAQNATAPVIYSDWKTTLEEGHDDGEGLNFYYSHDDYTNTDDYTQDMGIAPFHGDGVLRLYNNYDHTGVPVVANTNYIDIGRTGILVGIDGGSTYLFNDLDAIFQAPSTTLMDLTIASLVKTTNEDVGSLTFQGLDADDVEQNYVSLRGTIHSDSAAFPYGRFGVSLLTGGTSEEILTIANETMTLWSQSIDAPEFIMQGESKSTINALNILSFAGWNSSDASVSYARMYGKASNTTAGSEEGSLETHVEVASAITKITTVNGLGLNIDNGLSALFWDVGNSNKVSVKAGAMTADWSLTLPVAAPAADDYVLSAKTTGVSTWVAPSGGDQYVDVLFSHLGADGDDLDVDNALFLGAQGSYGSATTYEVWMVAPFAMTLDIATMNIGLSSASAAASTIITVGKTAGGTRYSSGAGTTIATLTHSVAGALAGAYNRAVIPTLSNIVSIAQGDYFYVTCTSRSANWADYEQIMLYLRFKKD